MANSVPIQLKAALSTVEVLDPGLLKAYPRTLWARLATPSREAELRHTLAAISATSSSFSQFASPSFPSALNTAGGIAVGSMDSAIGDSAPCVPVGTAEVQTSGGPVQPVRCSPSGEVENPACASTVAVGGVEFSGSFVHANMSGPVQAEECSQSGDVGSSVDVHGCMRALMGSSGFDGGGPYQATSI